MRARRSAVRRPVGRPPRTARVLRDVRRAAGVGQQLPSTGGHTILVPGGPDTPVPRCPFRTVQGRRVDPGTAAGSDGGVSGSAAPFPPPPPPSSPDHPRRRGDRGARDRDEWTRPADVGRRPAGSPVDPRRRRAKVTGQARYTADLAFPGLAHARLLLAGRAHARIVRLDTTRARSLPGVLAVLTQDDVPERRYGSFDYVLDRTLFARDVVRFEGEVVAAVAALTPEGAAAAVAAIEVEYDDLPAILDVERALDAGSPLVHPAIDTYGHDPNLEPAGNVAGPLDHRKGRCDRGPRCRAHRRPRALRRRHGPSGSDRAPHRDCRLVRRPGDDLLLDPGSVHGPRQDGRGPRDPGAPRSGSSSAISAAGSAASATSTSRATSPRSPGLPVGRSGSSSAGARSSLRRTR